MPGGASGLSDGNIGTSQTERGEGLKKRKISYHHTRSIVVPTQGRRSKKTAATDSISCTAPLWVRERDLQKSGGERRLFRGELGQPDDI